MGKGICVRPLRSIGRIANTNITPGLPLALLKDDFDVIHAHLPTPWSADWSAVASVLKSRPLVLTYHSDIVGRRTAGYIAQAYNSTALKFLLKVAARITVSRRGYLSRHLEGYRDKVVEIPPGVDVEAFRPVHAESIADIFFLSVLDEFHTFKGLEVLFDALGLVKKHIGDVKAIVGGDGALAGHYKSMASSMGLEDNVQFVGLVPEEMLNYYYNACKLFVLPSTDPALETFGIVLLEAMACGRPVVATDIAGMAEDIRKHGAGIVVSRGSASELAEAIIYLLQEERKAADMGASGRRLVEEKYSWHQVAGQMERLYKELA